MNDNLLTIPGYRLIEQIYNGSRTEEAVERAKKQGNIHCYLQKAWSEKELIDCIKEGLGKL